MKLVADDIIKFVRQRDLIFRKEIGRGACGRTVLLYDDIIDQDFVCKKYAPHNENLRSELFENFKREIKLLHLLQHPNVVRVFNYFLYPENFAGYILMEFIEGTDIESYLSAKPASAASIFRQAIHGFNYLEKNEILHRDIRPQNLLVSEEEQLKIIDFGFGKRIATPEDFGKSVSLNWWCDSPNEFTNNVYDFKTEVYFVGKLFQLLLEKTGVEDFEYAQLLKRMCDPNPDGRIESFSQCLRAIFQRGITDPPFSEREIEGYRDLADRLHSLVVKIEVGTKYVSDSASVLGCLEVLYPKVMLEEFLPKNTLIVSCFIKSGYYFKNDKFPTSVVKDFLKFFRACSPEQRNVVLANLHTRLDSVPRYNDQEDEEIPF